MKYGLPRADMLSAIEVDFSPVPRTSNPLGINGVGVDGTAAATPTVMNAIRVLQSEFGRADASGEQSSAARPRG